MPDFMVIKSPDCTDDQESDLIVALTVDSTAVFTLVLGAHAALMSGTDDDVQVAQSFVGNGLDTVVTAADSPLPSWLDDDLPMLFGAQTLLDPDVVDAKLNPQVSDPSWGFTSDCSAGGGA